MKMDYKYFPMAVLCQQVLIAIVIFISADAVLAKSPNAKQTGESWETRKNEFHKKVMLRQKSKESCQGRYQIEIKDATSDLDEKVISLRKEYRVLQKKLLKENSEFQHYEKKINDLSRNLKKKKSNENIKKEIRKSLIYKDSLKTKQLEDPKLVEIESQIKILRSERENKIFQIVKNDEKCSELLVSRRISRKPLNQEN